MLAPGLCAAGYEKVPEVTFLCPRRQPWSWATPQRPSQGGFAVHLIYPIAK